ncbi:uncharacterized protein BT62DRAFT_925121 [Guyanagaster necrorhizus]|uniref:Ribosome biogenesis protein NSA1 n=1 Tax=Guyanagaster necrorhizus TaxID=856835 RepID=A0A9P7W5Z5_9AGAR|nr:uncharacterized protein BT62DRAFT_925121 [Guyanagaster necrorhizus MCA 3950]KAG7452565.1 hypothetical protein BT62DRAFT_925121 [Guyanagaster necrorhizus MCA 3950]
MPRFVTGDSLGNIKSLTYPVSGKKTELAVLSEGPKNSEDFQRPIPIQALAVDYKPESTVVAAAYGDGSASTYSLKGNTLTQLHHWKENRVKANQKYVGMSIASQGIFTCTSNGALRMTPPSGTAAQAQAELRTALLPTRLYSWKLAADQETFAYGGDEVDLSLWNTEQAFQQPAMPPTAAVTKKRKRNTDLLPGEIWRAKNVSNDSLSLRQPIRVTSLAYLSTESPHHFLVGTQLGHLRRYDTRAARRPVADWIGIVKAGSVRAVEKGFSEHEAFVSDNSNSMFSVDLRTGRALYGYKGISGAVSSIAPSPTILASASLDRYFRLHSTVPPPSEIGQNSEDKGQILDKVYSKSIPTVIVWDGDIAAASSADASAGNEDDAVWDAMENVGEDNDDSDSELNDKKWRKV